MAERDIFLAALERSDPAERAAYLDQACRNDDALRGRIEALLRSNEDPVSNPTPVITPGYPATLDFIQRPATPPGKQGAEPDEALAFLAPPTRPDSLGRIGHYEVLQVLGKGGFGIVFRAFDDVLQRVVAVKILAPQLAATSPARKRFLREARMSAQIRHENVVQVYEVAEHPLPYLVMEFIPGEPLQHRLNRTGPLDVGEILRIGRQIAEGLAAAHAGDLIHRDIKPGNILLEGGSQKVKITDFGLARAADDASISQSGVVAGTPMFMAPEQARGDSLDQRADLFSLGSVLYQMVTGRPPFRANNVMGVLKRVVEDTPRPIHEVIPETPAWLCDIIAKLQEKNPDDRFQSAREVADLLAECETRLKQGTPAAAFPALSRAPAPRTGRWKWTAAASGLVCAAVGVIYALTRPDPNQATTPIPPVVRSDAPPAQLDAERDRKAAVYVLSIDGGVCIDGVPEIHRTVEGLPKAPFALTSVHLRDNQKVTDDGLAFFRGCRNVTHLHLAVTRVTDAGLANFKDCRHMTVVDLFSTNVGDVGLAHFQACKLTHLSLRSTQVTDAVGAYFGHCTDLEFLSLAHTKVTDAGLAHFRTCMKLKHLDLDGLPVGEAAVTPFAACPNLEILHLGGTQLTDEGAARFQACKGLKTLFLLGTKVTAAGIDGLTAALPRCRIEWNGGVIEPAAPDG